MDTIIKWILFAVLIMAVAWIVPGIAISGLLSALIVVLVIGLVNIFIRPLIEFISLPINFLTLGLFSLVINALLFLLVAKITPGFEIDGFWSALLGSLILALTAPLIERIEITTKKD